MASKQIVVLVQMQPKRSGVPELIFQEGAEVLDIVLQHYCAIVRWRLYCDSSRLARCRSRSWSALVPTQRAAFILHAIRSALLLFDYGYGQPCMGLIQCAVKCDWLMPLLQRRCARRQEQSHLMFFMTVSGVCLEQGIIQ